MTMQIQFFCSPQEEQAVLEHLTNDKSIAVFRLQSQQITALPHFSPAELPAWPEFVCFYLWAQDFGPLQWHNKRPTVEAATHRSVVARLFAREDWDKSVLSDGDRLLDQELSPGICYKRAEYRDGRTGPCTLIAPPSSLQRVGLPYVKWVNRCFGWVRRRGKKVHDWRNPSKGIPNPDEFLNTVYALPDAALRLETGDHPYSII